MRELRHAARGPLAGRRPRLDPDGPGQRRLGQIVFGDIVRVADGEHDSGKPLTQASVGVLDCLRLAMESGLRFQDNAQALYVGDDIHSPMPGPLLEVRWDSSLGEEMGQSPILEVFLLIHLE